MGHLQKSSNINSQLSSEHLTLLGSSISEMKENGLVKLRDSRNQSSQFKHIKSLVKEEAELPSKANKLSLRKSC